MPIQIQVRRGQSGTWSSVNPVLADGEIALESDTSFYKVGDGVNNWNDLPYGGLRGVQGTAGIRPETFTNNVNSSYPSGGPNNPQGYLNYYYPSATPGYAVVDLFTSNLWIKGSTGVWNNLGAVVGVQGTQGIQGRTGSQGIVGSVGSQGVQGLQGLQGLQGGQGVQGIAGLQGLQGIQGKSVQGTKGEDGARGLQGVQGIQGPSQGPPGIQGADGIQGLQGATGQSIQGIQGVQGLQGLQGIQGRTGSQGISGIIGLGLQGLQGVQGVQGLQGRSGIQGASGQDGLQGMQGVQGRIGSQGILGQSGLQGLQGLQGIQGIQGRVGSQGVSGIQGIQGGIGSQGTAADPTQVQLALTTANTALSRTYEKLATVANIPTTAANNTQIEVFDSTGIESFPYLQDLPNGFVGNSSTLVRLRYDTSVSLPGPEPSPPHRWFWVDSSLKDYNSVYNRMVLETTKLWDFNGANTTSLDFTSIPSWVKRITMNLAEVSTNGTSPLQVQLSSSGWITTAGSYLGSVTSCFSGTPISSSHSTGFLVEIASLPSIVRHGQIVLTYINPRCWVVSSNLSRSDAANSLLGSGSITLPQDFLDGVRLTTVLGGSSNAFDAGKVNILYEGYQALLPLF